MQARARVLLVGEILGQTDMQPSHPRCYPIRGHWNHLHTLLVTTSSPSHRLAGLAPLESIGIDLSETHIAVIASENALHHLTDFSIGECKDVHLLLGTGEGNIGLIHIIDQDVVVKLVNILLEAHICLGQFPDLSLRQWQQRRHQIFGHRLVLQQDVHALLLLQDILADPELLAALSILAMQLPVGKWHHNTVKLQPFGLVYGHDTDCIIAGRCRHRQLVTLGVPIAEKLSHRPPTALPCKVTHTILKSQQMSRLLWHRLGLLHKLRNDVLNNVGERHRLGRAFGQQFVDLRGIFAHLLVIGHILNGLGLLEALLQHLPWI